MGRTTRGKLLIPSLIAVASAIACGGTSIGGDGDGFGDPNGGADSAGGSFEKGGGPVESSGGANSISPGGPAYAGAATAGGAVGVLYGCPPSLPATGSRCALPADGPGYCKYPFPYPINCGQPVIALCDAVGAWEVMAPEMECGGIAGAPNDPGALTCPDRRPTTGSRCDIPTDVESYQCIYPNGYGCSQLIETCNQHRTWSTAQTFSDCAGAGGAG
jgi:hypothetical protein